MIGKCSAVCFIFLGLILLALELGVDTGKSYGFVMGENEGLKSYFGTTVITLFVDANLKIDLFFDPIGYILIFLGFANLGQGKKVSNGKMFAVIGCLSYILMNAAPFMFNEKNTIIALVITYGLQVLSTVVIMLSLMVLITVQIDNYTYQHIGKDLKFGAEIFATCMIIKKILLLFSRIQLFFATGLFYVVTILAIVSMGYYVYKAWNYIRLMDLFSAGGKDE